MELQDGTLRIGSFFAVTPGVVVLAASANSVFLRPARSGGLR